MALLTAQDVLDKKFQTVKFREGYDIDEVDLYLDEVVNTIYNLQVENTELKQKLEEANQRIADLQDGAPAVAAVVVEPTVGETPEAPVAPAAPVVAAQPVVAISEPESATTMLAMAQRLHDEYVNDGKAEGERLIAEARAKSEEIVASANNERRTILRDLDGERALLEDKINHLRDFESDYRARLGENLQHLLNELKEEN